MYFLNPTKTTTNVPRKHTQLLVSERAKNVEACKGGKRRGHQSRDGGHRSGYIKAVEEEKILDQYKEAGKQKYERPIQRTQPSKMQRKQKRTRENSVLSMKKNKSHGKNRGRDGRGHQRKKREKGRLRKARAL